MKLFRTTTIIGVIAITLASCGGTKTVYVTDSSPETTPETTDAPIATPAPTEAPVVYTDEDEFIYDINTSYDNAIYLEDQDMIDAGYATCEALRSGGTAYETISAIASSADGDPDIEELLTSVVASAILNFCPEQEYKFSE
jgi:hypothetical protein